MDFIKVSIITVTFNSKDTIEDCMKSVLEQDYHDLEHVIIDGGSNDGTLDIISSLKLDNTVLVSEPDQGIYDALNKGIHASTGDVIGILHSDDLFYSSSTISSVVHAFKQQNVDAVFGDIIYVDRSDINKILRYWKATSFSLFRLRFGWMPPHTSLFLSRNALLRTGDYSLEYDISADYDMILRLFSTGEFSSCCLDQVLVTMRAGGVSNRNFLCLLKKSLEDYRIIKKNNLGGVGTLLLKIVSKLPQFFDFRRRLSDT